MKSSFYSHVASSLRTTPLAVLALAAYVSTSSSMLFPEDNSIIIRTRPWFVSYFNGFDVALFACLSLTCVLVGLRPSRQGTTFLLAAFLAIIVSLLASSDLPSGALFDALVHFLRFACVFAFVSGATRLFGPRQSESVFVCLYLILCASAVVVYQLVFEENSRIYAAGMCVGSFAHVSGAMCIIAVFRRQYAVLAISSIYLVLSFSVTATLMFMLVAACIPLIEARDDEHPVKAAAAMRPLQQIFVVGTLVAGIAIAVTFVMGDVGYNLKFEDAADGHGRKEIWLFAVRLLRSGHVGLLGVGFFRPTGLFQDQELLGRYADRGVDNSHFHSIFFEGLIGLGVLCLPLFWMFFRRIWATWRTQQYLPCAICVFFLLTQSVDFTLYRPKELIIWAFLLGMADGQFLEGGKKTGERRKGASVSLTCQPRRIGPRVLAGAARN